MNWLDAVLLGVIAISILISLVRGFVREVLSLLVWGAAFWLSLHYAGFVAHWLDGYIGSPTFRIAAAFGVIFAGVLLAGALINYLAVQVVGRTGLSGTDRALGVVFGGLRGVFIIGVLILLGGLTALPRESWWQGSTLTAWFTPRVCALGVERWLEELRVYVPIAKAEVAEGEPVAGYWNGFCARTTPTGTANSMTQAAADDG